MARGDQQDFLGVGWAYPVATDPMRGDVAMARYESDVREAIRIILETAPGERVMRPSFGCGIHQLVFEEINSTTIYAVQASVRDALIQWEPRIEVNEVTVDPVQAVEGVLYISLDYRVRDTNQLDNLVYPFFYAEGGGQ
jgi:phage baseplate assembly protein W